jgi:hypothetical protein
LENRGWNRFCLEAGRGMGGGGPNMYTHVSNCKNNKRKEKNVWRAINLS